MSASDHQQPPFPPAGYSLLGQLRPARHSNFWWTNALEEETGEKGILVFDQKQQMFLEANETLGMTAFLVEDAAPLLLRMCSRQFLTTYEREVNLIRIAHQAISQHLSGQQEGGQR
jgi:hypothetical protein